MKPFSLCKFKHSSSKQLTVVLVETVNTRGDRMASQTYQNYMCAISLRGLTKRHDIAIIVHNKILHRGRHYIPS